MSLLGVEGRNAHKKPKGKERQNRRSSGGGGGILIFNLVTYIMGEKERDSRNGGEKKKSSKSGSKKAVSETRPLHVYYLAFLAICIVLSNKNL